MKKLIAALALASAAVAVPALAGVGLSVELGAPGFYGQLDIGAGGYRPRVLNDQPVLEQRGYYNQSPVYLRVPAGQDRNWRSYCGRYNACDRPVYFVRDDWYRNEYAPRYRNEHSQGGRYDRRDDNRNDRWDNQRDNRRDYGNDRRDDHGHDRGDDHRNGHDQNNGHGQSNGHDQSNGRSSAGRDDHNGRHDNDDDSGHR